MWEAIKCYKERRARGDKMRPIWRVILILPLALLYWPMEAFVHWMDR
jgi:hypothetical protein